MVQAELSTLSHSRLTVKLFDTSMMNPTYSVDPYTGQLTDAGMHVERTSLRVTIKINPLLSRESWGSIIFITFELRGHFLKSGQSFTVLQMGIRRSQILSSPWYQRTLRKDGLSLESGTAAMNIPLGGQVDFQVEAMVGWVSRVYNPDATNQMKCILGVLRAESGE